MQMAQEIILENVTAADMLQFLSDNGTIDLNDVADKMRKSELQKIIDQHPFEIAQTGKDKRWRTYIKGEDGKRKLIAKSTLDDLHFALYDYYKIRNLSIAIKKQLSTPCIRNGWSIKNSTEPVRHISKESSQTGATIIRVQKSSQFQ